LVEAYAIFPGASTAEMTGAGP